MRGFIISIVLLFMMGSLSAQDPIVDDGIRIIDQYDSMYGYYVFAPEEISEKVVVFVHGYGALNPAVYGNWILHLVEDMGLTVIYPRYQESIFNPATEDFPITMSAGIRSAMDTLKSMSEVEHFKVYYTGHSYGGAAVAYYASEYATHNLPKPEGVLCSQPGTAFFKGMTLDDYDKIEEDIAVILISADDDEVVGDRLCRLVYSTIKSKNIRHVHHYPDVNGGSSLNATHRAPHDINMRLDNGIRNVTTTRALYDSQLDLEDTGIYQKLLDDLIDDKALDDILPVGEWLFAQWPDGTTVKPAMVK